jgi:hypothetical protein
MNVGNNNCMIMLAGVRYFEFVDIGQRGLERNTAVGSEVAALNIVIRIICGASYLWLCCSPGHHKVKIIVVSVLNS